MKYLKLFEDNDSYKEITVDEYNNYETLLFTHEEVNKIKLIIKDFDKGISFEHSRDYDHKEFLYQVITLRLKGTILYICKLPDDYFLIKRIKPLEIPLTKYFLVDQFSGLKKFLKNKI